MARYTKNLKAKNEGMAIANAECLEKDRKDYSKNHPCAEMHKLIKKIA